MSDPTCDGLCGIPSRFTLWDGTRLRCRYEMGHGGDHDWKKYASQFTISGGVFQSDINRWCYPVPKGCTCQPIRADSGVITDYIFSPDCEAHAK